MPQNNQVQNNFTATAWREPVNTNLYDGLYNYPCNTYEENYSTYYLQQYNQQNQHNYFGETSHAPCNTQQIPLAGLYEQQPSQPPPNIYPSSYPLDRYVYPSTSQMTGTNVNYTQLNFNNDNNVLTNKPSGQLVKGGDMSLPDLGLLSDLTEYQLIDQFQNENHLDNLTKSMDQMSIEIKN